QLRMMASLKLNRLHWHLTDGAGWRIQIDRYPLLTEVAAWRRGATWQQWRDGGAEYCRFDDPEASGGYYTKEEIREVVAYADSLHITVIPEIEMPGHSEEVLAVYPGLSCKGEPYSGGDFCIGNDATFEFLENVLTEVMELFPSEYIHIGGDECPKTRWEKCPACQARIKALGLKDDDRHSAEHYLQSYVTARIEKFLNEHGRRIIGWDEILEGELAPNATVMSWRGTEGGIYAAKMGHDAIMTPTTYCYLDYCQASDPENEPLNIGGYVPIEKLYSYEPVPDSLATDYAKHIIGVQANLWTEYIPTNEQLEYMLLPRVAALSEVQWCDRGTREWTRFAQALPHMLQIYDRMGLNYATTVFGVTGLTEKNAETGVEEIVLSTIDQTPIHYTLDGSEPTAESPVYTAPIALDKEYSVKAAVFREEIPTRVFSKTFTPTEQEKNNSGGRRSDSAPDNASDIVSGGSEAFFVFFARGTHQRNEKNYLCIVMVPVRRTDGTIGNPVRIRNSTRCCESPLHKGEPRNTL
ncbi:beta-hexosaminidase precursor, partial [human gut metagenome]